MSNYVSLANAFTMAGAELGASLPILKLTKEGIWVRGSDNTPVTDRRFAADVHNTGRGFDCYKDGVIVAELMAPVASGKRISREELPDHGPYQNGDGWKPTLSLQLRSTESGEEFIFKTNSKGGHSAIGALLRRYGNRLDVGKRGFPVIELGVGSYNHRKYGPVIIPIFDIIMWRNEEDDPVIGGGPGGSQNSRPDAPVTPINVMPNARQAQQGLAGPQDLVDDSLADLEPDHGLDF